MVFLSCLSLLFVQFSGRKNFIITYLCRSDFYPNGCFFMIRHLSFAVLYFLELIGKIFLLKYKTNSPSSISANKNFVNPKCK